jgi:hypothetical protein
MAKLKLVKLGCGKSTGERATTDYVYALVFIGKRFHTPKRGTGKVVTSPGYYMYSGQVRNLNDVIDSHYDPDKLYLIALMEQDYGEDFPRPERTQVQDEITPWFQAFGVTLTLSGLAKDLKPKMREAIKKYRTNDDLLDIRWLRPIGTAGRSRRGIRFRGSPVDGGDYWLRFERQ